MIVSASRRTDIPAFYSAWFMNRVRAGYCLVPNPWSPRQVTRVSLRPDDTEAVVFWTRYPEPLLNHLSELDDLGLAYYFLFTLIPYPRILHPKGPTRAAALRSLRRLSERIGPARVIWRYDPVIFSSWTTAANHRRNFRDLSRELAGLTHRCVISVLDIYAKIRPRMNVLAREGWRLHPGPTGLEPWFAELMLFMVEASRAAGMEIYGCAEDIDLALYGIGPGKCIDDGLIGRVFNRKVSARKDPGQRSSCGCVVSRDIGAYDTCLFGCQYCYATKNFDLARVNFRRHKSDEPMLLP